MLAPSLLLDPGASRARDGGSPGLGLLSPIAPGSLLRLRGGAPGSGGSRGDDDDDSHDGSNESGGGIGGSGGGVDGSMYWDQDPGDGGEGLAYGAGESMSEEEKAALFGEMIANFDDMDPALKPRDPLGRFRPASLEGFFDLEQAS